MFNWNELKKKQRIAQALPGQIQKNVRVRTGPGKPGKSWNFIMAFSRTGKSWERPLVLESSGNLLNSTKKI